MQSMTNPLLKALSALVLAFVWTVAAASDPQPYDAGALKAAQAAGKPVLVEIHADWCTECRMQDQILSKLTAAPPYAAFAIFRVDFDTQKEIVKALGARRQSTLLVFKGDKEVGRLVAVTREDRIRELLNKAL